MLPVMLDTPDILGGPGTPAVAAFAAESLAVAVGCSPAEAASRMADALDLRHRLPLLGDHVDALRVPVWMARRVAARSRTLSREAAAWVDRQLAVRVGSVGPAQLDRLVAEAAARCDGESLADRTAAARASWDVVLSHPDPATYAGTSHLHATGDTLDLVRFHDIVSAEAEALGRLGDTDTFEQRKAKALGVIADAQARLDLTSVLPEPNHVGPDVVRLEEARRAALGRRDAKVRLYLHASLADLLAAAGGSGPVGTAETLGPVTVEKIREWVGRGRVSIRPVIHVEAKDRWSVDRHDPPPRMAEEVRLEHETCVFPHCSRPARQADLDHIEAYVDPGEGGPPDQTSPANLAPLCRRHHRAKTGRRWDYLRLDSGELLWTGPSGLTALVSSAGTLTLPLP
jgi:hypothetical protein